MHLDNARSPVSAASAVFVLLLTLAVFCTVSNPLLALPALALFPCLLMLKRPDWIVFVVIVVAFTRGDAWLTGLTGVPFGTLMFVSIGAAFTVAAFYTNRPLTGPNAAFGCVVLFYAAAFLIGAVFGETTYVVGWSRDVLYAVLTFTAVFCFCHDRARFIKMLHVVVACGVLLSIVNILELLAPSSIQLSHSAGRAAGLLKNANTSAFIITAGFVVLQMCQRAVSPRWKWRLVPVQTLLLAGVLATFSRGGMLLMTAAVVISVVLERKQRASVFPTVCAVGATSLAVVVATGYFLDSSEVPVLYSMQKVATFLRGQIDDNYRLYLVKYYFLKFLEQPLAGYGFHASMLPSSANTDLISVFGVKGPHNTPVTIMVEFGIVPLMLYLFSYAVVFSRLLAVGDRWAGRYLLLLLGVLFAHNIFAHDMHLSRPTMVLFAILSVAPVFLGPVGPHKEVKNGSRKESPGCS